MLVFCTHLVEHYNNVYTLRLDAAELGSVLRQVVVGSDGKLPSIRELHLQSSRIYFSQHNRFRTIHGLVDQLGERTSQHDKRIYKKRLKHNMILLRQSEYLEHWPKFLHTSLSRLMLAG
jgi:hypothetical protein